MKNSILKRFARWAGITILVAYVLLVIGRAIFFQLDDRTEAEVAKIHATKLTIDDVMGKNLPPDPGEAADDTVKGIDANQNGIRDDVELAIFDEYPNSAKTRAALLQYALALQMEVTQKRLNEKTVNAVIEEDSRAGDCVADTLVPRKSPESSRVYEEIEKIDRYLNFVGNIQFNTEERQLQNKEFYKYMGSFSNLDKPACDIDVKNLPN